MSKFNTIGKLKSIDHLQELNEDGLQVSYIEYELQIKEQGVSTTKLRQILPDQTLLILGPLCSNNFVSYSAPTSNVIIIGYENIEKLTLRGPRNSQSNYDQHKVILNHDSPCKSIAIHGSKFDNDDYCCNLNGTTDDSEIHYKHLNIPYGLADNNDSKDKAGFIIYGPEYTNNVVGEANDITMSPT